MAEIMLDGITSKGSRFRKSVVEYDSIDSKNKSNRLIEEVNSFANPFPYQPMAIQSMVHDFLVQTNNTCPILFASLFGQCVEQGANNDIETGIANQVFL